MSLNIKSAEAHALAAELARLTGESMTKAVIEAIRERLERRRREREQEKLVAEVMAIGRRVAIYPRRDDRLHGEFFTTSVACPADDRRHFRASGDYSSDVCEGAATTMSLNIKSPEAHELAAELARLTGESMTKAVTEAIRERLERERSKRDEDKLFAELMEIAEQCAAYPRRDNRSLEEFLYDERGLPR